MQKYGTLPFSGIARIAFISTKILKSLNDLRIISQKDIESIYGNINTVTKELHADNLNIGNSTKRKNQFIKKYGHLRPSTYSLSSLNYREGYKEYFIKINSKRLFQKELNINFPYLKIEK